MFVCQCNCGEIEFEIKTPPIEIYVCHCSICCRFTGGWGMPVVIVENKSFRWQKGRNSIRIWSKPNAEWESNFCVVCGSSLPGKNDDAHMFVPAGLLPGDIEGLEVKHHIFVGSKARWVEIGDAGKQHEGPFAG